MRPRARARALLLAALPLAAISTSACQSSPAERYVAKDDHFSLAAPAGWTAQRDRGSVVFEAASAGRATIAVRAVPVEGDWTKPRTPELVFSATQKVLGALPSAEVAESEPVALDGFEATSYRVSFVPAGRQRRYERHHVVLVGGHYVYHLLHTAPAGELAATKKTFEAVLASFEEEV